MTSPVPAGPWREFTQDPRRAESAGLRASDRDRDVVLGVLTEGYAEGRLTQDEYDERAEATMAAKTLGDLPALILDLVPQQPRGDAVAASQNELHRRAVRHWESQRRQALLGFLLPTTICWAIWVMTSLKANGEFDFYFAWPVFVMLGTVANLVKVVLAREDIVAEEHRRLEKRKALEAAPDERPPDPDQR